jgi:hypothetical protein
VSVIGRPTLSLPAYDLCKRPGKRPKNSPAGGSPAFTRSFAVVVTNQLSSCRFMNRRRFMTQRKSIGRRTAALDGPKPVNFFGGGGHKNY